ncbi:TetR family transcriptional regulator [Actinomadura kijaniata]|uniref:TetR family transcriptional regulator n=1 Tax=Actinomadura kijaniata TaxID=46161 RepID=UPI0008307CCD|nr:TetR family transcriptional regulator [Actinomadura kijaniata]
MTEEPRSTLTERRKAATQTEIARAAAELFTEHGADGVTAEQIARRAGVALRTFYRYFPTKEEAVAPLLSVGALRWRDLLAGSPPGMPPREALERAAGLVLAEPDLATRERYRWMRGLLRAAGHDPALRAVWLKVNQDSEERLAPVLAGLMDRDPGSLEVRLAAAAATAAIRVALEAWAADDTPSEGPGSPADLGIRAIRTLTAAL